MQPFMKQNSPQIITEHCFIHFIMSKLHFDCPLSLICLVIIINQCCTYVNSQSFNESKAGFSEAVATWYGSETGAGSGGACGFADDVANAPYNGFISAGNHAIFKQGLGCGTCYQVQCTEHPSCSGSPITVTITDECPGACNNEAVHFDLSGIAFGALAKTGQDYTLRKAGRINIQYQSVPCIHNVGITFKVDDKANQYYLAFAIENLNGDGDISSVQVLPSGSGSWISAQRSWGAVWEVNVLSGMRGPYTISITTIESKEMVIAANVIPANWVPGGYYHSGANVAL